MASGILRTAALWLLAGLSAEEAVGIKCDVNVPDAGHLSAAVYRQDGTLARTLLYMKEVKPGKLRLEWEGHDDFGQPVAPGDYTIRTAISNTSAEYVMAIANGIQPSTHEDTGKVRCGRAVCIDAKGRMLLAGQIGGEGGGFQWFTREGKHVKTFLPRMWSEAVASDGKYAYLVAYSKVEGKPLAGVYRIDLDASVMTAAEVDYDGPGGQAVFPDRRTEATPGKYYPAGGHPLYKEPGWRLGEDATLYGPAADWWKVHSIQHHEGKLYIAVPSTDRIVVMDAASGKINMQIEVRNIQAVDFGPNGRLYACAGKEILVMDKDGKNRSVISDKFEAPYTLAVDSKGNIIVADHGGRPIPYGNTMPVLWKIAPDGKRIFRRGYSNPNDRIRTSLDGKLETHKYFHPTSLDTDAEDNIYVCEPSLPRVQKLNSGGGRLFSLTGIYAEEMCVDPEKPEEFYCTAASQNVRRYVLDYEKRTWRFDASWRRAMHVGKFMTVDMRIARVNGERFLSIWDGGLFRIEGDKLRYMKPWESPAIFEDGTAYPVEVDRKTGGFSVYRLPCAGFDMKGCPIYRPEDKKLIFKAEDAFNRKHGVSPSRKYHCVCLGKDDDDNFYVLVGRRGKGKGIPYWARMYEKAFLHKYDKSGRLVWSVGKKTSSFVKPGEFYGPNHAYYHKGFIFFCDVSGKVSVFDRYGLMVGFLMKDSARGVGFDDDPLGGCAEAWNHHFVTHPKSGKLYYFNQDHFTGGFRCIEIKGLSDLKYDSVQVTLKKAAAPKKESEEDTQQDYVAQIFKAANLSIDGEVSEWNETGSVQLWAEKNNRNLPYAKIRFRYDLRYLYVSVFVRGDDSPAKNKNAQSRDLMWKGDCLELYLGTDFKSWRKGAYAETDYQLMLAPGEESAGKAYCWTHHTWVKGSKVAWKVHDDKKGYSLEGQVPWSFFKGPPPKTGKQMPFDMRVMCGDSTGEKYLHNMIWSARNMAFNRTEQWGQAVLEHFAVAGEVKPNK